jgi:hypothetical protein
MVDVVTLREQQSLFAGLVGKLLVWIYGQGWEVTFGDFNRPDGHGHMANSLHYQRLAADLNLFVSGVYQDKDCVEWQQIGAYWESLHDLCRWGGRFPQADYNHVSLEWEGRA